MEMLAYCFLQSEGSRANQKQIRSVWKNPTWTLRAWNSWKVLDNKMGEVP